MEVYNIVIKIAYAFIVLSSIVFVLTFYFAGLNNINVVVDEKNRKEYRKTILLEKTLVLEASPSELGKVSKAYKYDHRRAVIPIEFFTHRSTGSEIGYETTGKGYCYFDEVSGLDGESFAFYVKPAFPIYRYSDNPRNLDCTTRKSAQSTGISSPVLLIRKARNNPPLPARVYIYEK